MALDNLEKVLSQTLKELKDEGRLKGKEYIITKVKKSEGEKGPRYFLKGKDEQEFIRMNSNSYLGNQRNIPISPGTGKKFSKISPKRRCHAVQFSLFNSSGNLNPSHNF